MCVFVVCVPEWLVCLIYVYGLTRFNLITMCFVDVYNKEKPFAIKNEENNETNKNW